MCLPSTFAKASAPRPLSECNRVRTSINRLLLYRMYAGISALSPSHLPTSIPKSHLRHASPVTIPVRSPPSQNQPTYPTHLLAITCNSKSQTGTSDHVPLIATHSLVLAAHCASLPRMPYSYTQVRNGAVTIPVIPLSVPSPAAFQTLHQYLYSHNIAQLLSTLIPSIPPQFLSTLSSQSIRSTLGTGSKLHQLSAHCFSQTRAEGGHPTQILMGQAQHINALWRNAVALGCSDNDLWDVIDLAWEVILGSLNLAAGVH